jgi:hypothetical protein
VNTGDRHLGAYSEDPQRGSLIDLA